MFHVLNEGPQGSTRDTEPNCQGVEQGFQLSNGLKIWSWFMLKLYRVPLRLAFCSVQRKKWWKLVSQDGWVKEIDECSSQLKVKIWSNNKQHKGNSINCVSWIYHRACLCICNSSNTEAATIPECDDEFVPRFFFTLCSVHFFSFRSEGCEVGLCILLRLSHLQLSRFLLQPPAATTPAEHTHLHTVSVQTEVELLKRLLINHSYLAEQCCWWRKACMLILLIN